MTMAGARTSQAPVCDIAIGDEFGWRCYRSGPVTLWFKGWLDGLDGAGLAQRIASAGATVAPGWFGDVLSRTDGHYALAATGPGWAVAAVDWIRSIPLAAARINGAWTLDDRPERLRRAAGLGVADHDPDAALAIAMSGYTIGMATLYHGMELP
ncbi:MAG TPA: hypothetical protein ENH05_07665, partial [Rhizobiales bacterium]|nr:hypothetical protein [Hyphomicrobiales bacterium]